MQLLLFSTSNERRYFFVSDRQKIECIVSRTPISLIILAYKYNFDFLLSLLFPFSSKIVFISIGLFTQSIVLQFWNCYVELDSICVWQNTALCLCSVYLCSIMSIFVSIVYGILECIALMTQSTMMQ